MTNLVKSFIGRVRRGELKNAAYLSYYYSYLFAYDARHGTRFAKSHRPDEMGTSVFASGTGNFPAHPRIVRLFLAKCGLDKSAPIIDVGHGSGMVLHVAAGEGYSNLTGVEYGKIPYDLSVENLDGRATLIHGDAFAVNMSAYEAIFFFSPFRDEMARKFFTAIPANVKTLLTINHDTSIEPLIQADGFEQSFAYRHPIYANFNGKIWKRRG